MSTVNTDMTAQLPSPPATATTYPVVATLTAIRKLHPMTQAQLANQAGLSRMTVQRLESNGLDPRLSTLQEMAHVLEHELVVIPSHLRAAFDDWLAAQPPNSPKSHTGQ